MAGDITDCKFSSKQWRILQRTRGTRVPHKYNLPLLLPLNTGLDPPMRLIIQHEFSWYHYVCHSLSIICILLNMSYLRFCMENIIMNLWKLPSSDMSLSAPQVLKYIHIILEIYNPFLFNTELSHHI